MKGIVQVQGTGSGVGFGHKSTVQTGKSIHNNKIKDLCYDTKENLKRDTKYNNRGKETKLSSIGSLTFTGSI